MKNSNIPDGRGRPGPEADNLAVICQTIVKNKTVVSNSFALTPDVIYFQFYTPIAVGV
jgi:hypothetical protein